MLKGCGGIILKENKVLLMKRKNVTTFNNVWSTPGGKIDDGETAEKAVVRELKEELGIKVQIVRKLGDYLDKHEDKIIGCYSGYLVEIISGVPQIIEDDKAENLTYFDLNNLPDNLAPYSKFYLERI